VSTPNLSIRAGHPDFLDLDWSRPVAEWPADRLVDLPTGIHRHPVVFVPYRRDIYAVKELPLRLARHEYACLRELRERHAPTVEPVGVVERPWLDPHIEGAGAVVTRYLDYTMSYRELLEGDGFGARRTQMINAFANLLAELHILGCFWGDASLSNVLYRFDAEALQVTMVDGETVELHDELTTGQRLHDIDIMITNVAASMADIAASRGNVDDADLGLGEDIAAAYYLLWDELTTYEEIAEDERYRIAQRIERLNDLGYQVEDVEIAPGGGGLRFRLRVGGRRFHATRLHDLTGVEATERQARVILGDLRYHRARLGGDTPSARAIADVQWRVQVFEPLLERIREVAGPDANPVQSYADFLNHRFLMASELERDVDNEEAFAHWVGAGKPGWKLSYGYPED
jgi:hypothetical protein